MRNASIGLIVTVLAIGFAAVALAAEPASAPQGKPQTKCPITDEEINKDVHFDYNGQRIYFCCAGCIATFKKNPASYLKKMTAEGIVLDKTPLVQTLCPITGNLIDKKFFVDYEGKRIFFSDAQGPAAFMKDPKQFVQKMNDQGVEPEKAPGAKTQDGEMHHKMN